MFKDNWEEKHGMNLPGHPNCVKRIQGSQVGNMILETPQQVSTHVHLSGSSSQMASSGPVSEPKHHFENHLRNQNQFLQTQPISSSSSCGNVELQIQPSPNLQELIKLLSASHGLPLKEIGSSEYRKLVEILQQSSVQSNGLSQQSGSFSVVGGKNNTQSVEIASIAPSIQNDEETIKTKGTIALADDESTICRDNNKEKMWDGSLQLSSSVTLSAVAFFKSGEKLLGNNWPEIIEVKGKVRLEAFEKYVQDLPRSRNRGLMVISLCWKEGSSDTGLTGMKEVSKGYQKSRRVGFAQLLSGVDLYICPRSDPIITILAKYGFFKGMSVIDDNQDSMIGCVVWRKNRSLNPVGNNTTLDSKCSPNQGPEKKLSPEKLVLESGQREEVDHNLVRVTPFEDDDLPEFDFRNACGKSSLVSQSQSQPQNPTIFGNGSRSVNCQNLDSGVVSRKSTVVSQSQPPNPVIFRNNGSILVNCQNLENSGVVTGKSPVVNESQPQNPAVSRNNGSTPVNCQTIDNSRFVSGKSNIVIQDQPPNPTTFRKNGSTPVNCQTIDNSRFVSGKSTVVIQGQPPNPTTFRNNGSMPANCQNVDGSCTVSGKSSQSQPLNPIFRNNMSTSVNCQNQDNSGIVPGKSTVLSQRPPLNPAVIGSTSVNRQKQDNASNGCFEPPPKRNKLFDDDDDDMPEWWPPELQKQKPPSNMKNLPLCPPPAGTHPSFSYQPFRFPAAPPPPVPRPPPLRHWQSPFPPSNDKRARP